MKFSIKGLGPAGQVHTLLLDAADAASARRLATEQGLQVLRVTPAGRWNIALPGLPARRSRFALELFTQELLALLESGLGLVEAIDLLVEKEQGKASAATLGVLRDHLRRGLSLSQGLTQIPADFPPLYVATVRAAEQSGDIPEALKRYLEYQTQIDRVKRKIISASIYPLMLMAVGLLVSAFMLLYVVPKFSRIYDEIGGQLPWLTRALVGWGQMLETHALPTLGGLAALLVLAAWGASRPAFLRWAAPKLWQIPAVGARLRTYELGRFYRTMGMLLKSGIPLPTALDMAGGLLSPFLRPGMQRAAREIREGLPVSRAFMGQGLTTAVSARLLGVGERSGRMPQMVERIALFYEDELARWVDWFTRLFEPILMVMIGALVGLIVVLLYLPIFELAENVK